MRFAKEYVCENSFYSFSVIRVNIFYEKFHLSMVLVTFEFRDPCTRERPNINIDASPKS